MNVFSTFVLFVGVLVLTTSVGAAGGRRGQWKKRNKNKRQKNKQSNLTKDPTDLSNLMSSCPGNGQMSALFGGMFLSENKLDALVSATQVELSPAATKRRGPRRSYVRRNRLSKKIATVDTFASASRKSISTGPADETCCKTELRVTAPGEVMVDGKSMSVVHMNHSYQYVQEGECVTPGAKCRSIGICTQRYKLAYMLLYDPDLVGKINPPVRYGSVPVKSHCECMNIGRVM